MGVSHNQVLAGWLAGWPAINCSVSWKMVCGCKSSISSVPYLVMPLSLDVHITSHNAYLDRCPVVFVILCKSMQTVTCFPEDKTQKCYYINTE